MIQTQHAESYKRQFTSLWWLNIKLCTFGKNNFSINCKFNPNIDVKIYCDWDCLLGLQFIYRACFCNTTNCFISVIFLVTKQSLGISGRLLSTLRRKIISIGNLCSTFSSVSLINQLRTLSRLNDRYLFGLFNRTANILYF